MNAIQTMIWKDTRQNVQWIIIALATFGGLFCLLVWAGHHTGDRWHQTRGFFDWWMCALLPFAGVGLGTIIAKPESRGDEWAFLVHRPMSLATIFSIKLTTAGGLYLLACVLPVFIAFACGTSLAAMPDATGALPDQAGVTLWPNAKEVFSVCCGLACIPLGIILAMSPGNWYSGRGAVLASLPTLISLCVSAEEVAPGGGGTVMAAMVGVLAVVAGRAVFLDGVSRGRLRNAGAPTLAAFVYAGMATVLGILLFIVLARVENSSHAYDYLIWDLLGPTASTVVDCAWGVLQRSHTYTYFYHHYNPAISGVPFLLGWGVVGLVLGMIVSLYCRARGPAMMGWVTAGFLVGVLGRLVYIHAFYWINYNDPLTLVFHELAITASGVTGMAACIFLALRWRLGVPATIAWAIGGFAMGILGPLVMRCVEPHPIFIVCSACGKRRSANSADCERCNASATVAADGSEVLEPLTGAVQTPVA